MSDEAKYLSQADVNRLETSINELSSMQKDLIIENEVKKRLKVELTLISANYKLKSKEVEEATISINQAQAVHKDAQTSHKTLVQTLTKVYDLPDGKWGFDPISGEVKID